MRPRSEWEIKTYLKNKHSPTSLTKILLNKLSNIGLVDDLAFARSWVNSRRLLKTLSRRKIFQELLIKHVEEEVINQVLAEDETDELAVLRELVAKKRSQSRYKDKLKLMQYLSSKGFTYDNIKSVVNEENNFKQ
jgi:regulatory protein